LLISANLNISEGLIAVHKRVHGTLKGEYVYNGKGERVKRTVYPDVNPPATFYYVYDLSGQLIGEYDELGELKGEYVYGPTGRLATLKKWYGMTRWHHNDHLGAPQALSNRDGIVIWQADYTPFGVATLNKDPDGDGNNANTFFRFPGQYWDWETQTHYNYFRTYDQFTGRYTQHDPIGLDGGMNPYGYVLGDPINLRDANGLRTYSNPAEASAMATAEAMGYIPGMYPNNPQDLTNIAAITGLGAPIVGSFCGAGLMAATVSAHVANRDWDNLVLDALGYYGTVIGKAMGMADDAADWFGYVIEKIGSIGKKT